MKSLTKIYEYNSSIEDVWHAFTNPKYIELWDAGPVEMSDSENSEFKLWGGDIFGTNTKVEKFLKLEQDWFSGNWDEPSKVAFKFEDLKNKIKVTLNHTNIPDNEFDSINRGWDDYYLGAIEKFLKIKRRGQFPDL